jgi:nucleoside 2-deoxyribosyltransferase
MTKLALSGGPLVYLAGPITGLTYADCTNWREYAKLELAKVGIRGLSPMRGKEYLEAIARDTAFTADGDKYAVQGPLSTNKGITTRDRWDTQRVDLVLANFADAKPGYVSIGTCIELGWADAAHVPVIGVLPQGNPHEHGMVMEILGFRVDTLDKALTLAKAILL